MTKILIVDDEEHIRFLYSEELTEAGYEVITADSGHKLLERIEKEKPDLVVLDLMLPGIDGLEICKMLKSDSVTAAIPIIMVTAKGEAAELRALLGRVKSLKGIKHCSLVMTTAGTTLP